MAGWEEVRKEEMVEGNKGGREKVWEGKRECLREREREGESVGGKGREDGRVEREEGRK